MSSRKMTISAAAFVTALCTLIIRVKSYTLCGKQPSFTTILTTPSLLRFRFSPSSSDKNNNEYDSDINYDDILNFNRPTTSIDPMKLQFELSIENKSDLSSTKSMTRYSKTNKNNQPRWSDYDDFLEEELGELDSELVEKDMWIQELRDVVEQKVGYSIWSKRSDQEIQKDIKKTLANKGANVPENIAKIIRAVFIEKTHTMKQYKKENDFAAGEFRKWIIEQKKKTKKDPLPPAKIEVVRSWLLTHPRQSQIYYDAKNKIPPVIMDECTKPVYGVSFGARNAAKDGEKASSAFTATSSMNSAFSTSGSMITQSMVNWEKKKEEIVMNDKISKSNRDIKNNEYQFKIDDDEVFVATNSNNDYFVVI